MPKDPSVFFQLHAACAIVVWKEKGALNSLKIAKVITKHTAQRERIHNHFYRHRRNRRDAATTTVVMVMILLSVPVLVYVFVCRVCAVVCAHSIEDNNSE